MNKEDKANDSGANLNVDEIISNTPAHSTNDSELHKQAEVMGKIIPEILLNKGTILTVFSCKRLELTGALTNHNESVTDEEFEDLLAESMINWDPTTFREFTQVYKVIGKSLKRAKAFLKAESEDVPKPRILTLRRP